MFKRFLSHSSPARKVIISKDIKTSTQSGLLHHNKGKWRIDFDRDSHKTFSNDLMGWVSGGDALQAVSIKFDSCESAVAFANSNNFSYTIKRVCNEEHDMEGKNYGINFLPNDNRVYRTK